MDDQPARPIDNLIKPFLNKNVDFDLSIELSLFGRIDTYFSKKNPLAQKMLLSTKVLCIKNVGSVKRTLNGLKIGIFS